MTVYQPKGLLFVGPDGAALDLAGAPAAAHGASAGASAGVPAGQAAGGDTTVPVPSGFLASGGGASTAQASAPAPIPTASPSASGPSASVATPDGPAAVRIKLTAKGTFMIADGPGCDGPFVDRSAPIKASAVVVSAAADRSPSASDDPKDLLQLCGTSGRTVYRGDLLAVDDAASGQAGQHTVNQLRLEPYLRS